MEKLNKDKLILPIVILLASLALGGFYYASQVNKQKSIERQQAVKIEQDKQEQAIREQKEKAEKEELKQKDENEKAIKKECAEWALNKASNNKTTIYQQDEYDDYFARCLREKGL